MRNSIKYNTMGMLTSKSPGFNPADTGIYQLNRVQNSSYSIAVNRENVSHLGDDDFLVRKIYSAPTVEFNCSYLSTDGRNEHNLGFNIAKSGDPLPVDTFTNGIDKDINLFVAVSKSQDDFNFLAGDGLSGIDVIGLGNCFLRSYSIRAEVGSFVTTELIYDGSHIRYDKFGNHEFNGERMDIPNPSVNRTGDGDYSVVSGFNFEGWEVASGISAINHGSLSMSLPDSAVDIGGSSSNVSIQSFNINIPIQRVDFDGLGSNYKYFRKISYPLLGTLNVRALANDFETGILDRIICNDQEYSVEISVDRSVCSSIFACDGEGQDDKAMKFVINGLLLESYSLSNSVSRGDNAIVDLNYSFSITKSKRKGIFASGSFD